MKDPRTPGGGDAGVQGTNVERPARRPQDTANTIPSVVTRPPSSLSLALDHLDDAGLCACWTSPDPRRCRRWSK